jgi:hypothetical protein
MAIPEYHPEEACASRPSDLRIVGQQLERLFQGLVAVAGGAPP